MFISDDFDGENENCGEFIARDGVKLSYHFYEPLKECNGKLVLILPAAQTPQRYYRHFARYMAKQGFTVMSFDYRGVGLSLRGELKEQKHPMHKWGEVDAPSALDFAMERYPELTPVAVAHSHGGQVLGMSDLGVRLESAYLIGSQLGYWKLWPHKKWLLLLFFWYIYIPLSTKILGYMLGKPIGLASMPSSVAKEWAGWCKNKDYIFAEFRPFGDDVKSNIYYLTIEDDWLAPEKAALALSEKYYPNAKHDFKHISASDYDMKSIGHFGWFRKNMDIRAWQEAVAWFK